MARSKNSVRRGRAPASLNLTQPPIQPSSTQLLLQSSSTQPWPQSSLAQPPSQLNSTQLDLSLPHGRPSAHLQNQNLIYADAGMLEARRLAQWEIQKSTTDIQQRFRIKALLARFPEPTPDDPDRSPMIRTFTSNLLSQLDTLLPERIRLAPVIHTTIETSLVNLRVNLDFLYWRIFRINDLPPEILANIFRFVAWDANHQLGVKCRLFLTWVCRRWRWVAISDSTIWNVIWFKPNPSYEQHLTWLERAGTGLLDMRIMDSEGENGNKFTGETMGSLMDTISIKLSQIRNLVVVVGTWPPALAVLDKLSQFGAAGTRIGLERFEIHRTMTPYIWIGPDYKPADHQFPIKLFGGATAPNLKYLSLNGIHVDWANSHISNLTALDLRRMPLEVSPDHTRFRQMLQSCPNLFKLALDGFGPSLNPKPDMTLGPIRLPRLRVLILGDFSLYYGLFVLAQLDTSGVRDLTLMNMTGEDYTPFVVAMTSRFKEVQILTLYTVEVDDSLVNRRLFVKWLESMPNVCYLKVAQVRPQILQMFVEPQTVKAATSDASSAGPSSSVATPRQVVCPKIDIVEYQSIQALLITRFVVARRQVGGPIRKVYVNDRWISSITEDERVNLRRVTNLFVVPTGGTTPEEIVLSKAFTS